MSEEKKQDFKLQELVTQREQMTTVMTYSIQRIDILIIALCTSGIFLSITTLSGNQKAIEMKWALSSFCLSIVVNLISQFVSYYAGRAMYRVFDEMVIDYQHDPDSFKEDNYKDKTDSIHSRTPAIHTMNIASLILLVAGMGVCLLYYYRF